MFMKLVTVEIIRKKSQMQKLALKNTILYILYTTVEVKCKILKFYHNKYQDIGNI